jgi:hypothetical protein
MNLKICYVSVLDVIGIIWIIIGVGLRNTTRKLIPCIVSPPRIKPNVFRVKAEGLIATRSVGKEFLKYISLEDQGDDDFLRLRKKYYEIYFVWMMYKNGNW